MTTHTKLYPVAIAADIPMLLYGSPGIGKTKYTEALFVEMKAHGEVVIASLRDPTDFGGLPIRDKERGVRFLPPEWAVRANQAAEDIDRGITCTAANGKYCLGDELHESVIIFLDELTTAASTVQAAMLRMLMERQLGDLVFHPRVRFVAAANPPEEAAGGHNLEPPMANRLAHLQWPVDVNKWVEGMLNGWPTPDVPKLADNWEDKIPHYRTLIATFIKRHPGLLHAMPKDEEARSAAWPSGRTWDMSARFMAALVGAGYKENIFGNALGTTVGSGAAAEFVSWFKNMDLPDPNALIKDPTKFVIDPDRPDRTFVTLSSVTNLVITALDDSKKRDDYWIAAWKMYAHAATHDAADAGAAMVLNLKDVVEEKNMWDKLPSVKQYAVEFHAILQKAGIMQ